VLKILVMNVLISSRRGGVLVYREKDLSWL
jgi:hypothetical protein